MDKRDFPAMKRDKTQLYVKPYGRFTYKKCYNNIVIMHRFQFIVNKRFAQFWTRYWIRRLQIIHETFSNGFLDLYLPDGPIEDKSLVFWSNVAQIDPLNLKSFIKLKVIRRDLRMKWSLNWSIQHLFYYIVTSLFNASNVIILLLPEYFHLGVCRPF